MHTRDTQLPKDVRLYIICNNRRKRVGSAALVFFIERHVVGLETQLHIGDQRESFQHMNSVQLEKRRKVESPYDYILDEEGRRLRDIEHICEVLPLAAERKNGSHSHPSRVPSGSSPRRRS